MIKDKSLCDQVGEALSPELLKGQWKKDAQDNRYAGHCYIASESLYHLVGGKNTGWIPCFLNNKKWPDELNKGETHWFIKNRETGEILDPTSKQFKKDIPYHKAIGCGFLTKKASNRAQIIIDRVNGEKLPVDTFI